MLLNCNYYKLKVSIFMWHLCREGSEGSFYINIGNNFFKRDILGMACLYLQKLIFTEPKAWKSREMFSEPRNLGKISLPFLFNSRPDISRWLVSLLQSQFS